MSDEKIQSLKDLAQRARHLRESGKRIVHCHGVFDLLHIGHIRYLERAKKEGDVLFVTLTADAYVNKGPGRPVFPEHLRAESLAALSCVDGVAVNHAVSAVDALHLIRPNVYCKGGEYRNAADDVTGNITLEKEAVEHHGGRIFYADEIVFSSSSLLNEHFGVFKPETMTFLKEFRSRWPEKEVHRMVASLADLKVLVVGDAIIDQYHYTSLLGQTGKGSHLAVRYESEEQFAGGAIAVANHISGFAKNVTLVTGLGESDGYEPFVREKLSSNISPVLFQFPDAPTVTKRRFIDSDMNKLFEVYFFKENAVHGEVEDEICQWLDTHLAEFDVVVVPDFGNGFITPRMISLLTEKGKFLAVNTQINSGNRGYHVIQRYQRADFVSLNEPELRLAARNRHGSLESISELVGEQVHAKRLAVTRGTKGIMMNDREKRTVSAVPALSTKVVDRVGAGDAFLSLAALCAAKQIDAEVSAFIGSVAAAMDVQIVGNRHFVEKAGLSKYVSTLLK